MERFELMRRFARDEDGAVTVDFVVLTSAIVAMVVAVILAFGSSTNTFADTVSGEIADIDVLMF